jgi:membrane carboxypeptidase/penicillin-binding protein PbpC
MNADGTALVPTPSKVERREICALSGMAANPWCPTKTSEWLPSESARIPCSWHHESEDGLLTVWPAVYRQWASEHQTVRGVRLQADRHSVGLQSDQSGADLSRPAKAGHHVPEKVTLAIANPPAGAVYLIDPTLRGEYQTLPLRATADGRTGIIQWEIDGKPFGGSPADNSLPWPLASGAHRISAHDEQGRIAEVRILVK